MKLDIGGEQEIKVNQDRLWQALNDPEMLSKCVPGCKEMIETTQDAYKVTLELKVAAVGGSFEGEIALSDKQAPEVCRISVSGEGTLGHGTGDAMFQIIPDGPNRCKLKYEGKGEIGGLVAGVGQRVLGGVSKHLIKRFFKALDSELNTVPIP